MARPMSGSKKTAGINTPLPPELTEEKLADNVYDKGMYTDIDPAIIPSGGLQLAQNAVVRDNKTSRRPGTSLFTPPGPDSNRVLKVTDYVRGNGVTNIVRHTKNSIWYLTTNTWIQCLGPALLGTDYDHFSTVIINDRYFFCNNGKNPIMELNLATNTYSVLGNAPNYKKITGFFNRLIGANLQGASPNPTNWGWSGDLNFSEWLSVNDPSAGTETLTDANVDISDFITDVFGFDAVLIILRQKSIWVSTKQPSASNPFNTFAKIPGLGCTCTYGSAKFTDGIIFPDLRTKSIYIFKTDGTIEDIGIPVRRALFAAISDPDAVFSSYNPIEAEFSICIPNEFTSITKEWRFNLRAKAWTYNEIPVISAIEDVDNISGSRTIDELQGTIDSLLGTIDGLSTPISQLPRRIYGRFDGHIAVETDGQINDTIFYLGYGYNYGYNYGIGPLLLSPSFPTVFKSKVYVTPGNNIYISSCNFEMYCRSAGTFTLEFSKDGGKTFITQRVFNILSTQLTGTISIFHRKQFISRRFQWRLTTTDIDCDLISDVIKNYPISALDK